MLVDMTGHLSGTLDLDPDEYPSDETDSISSINTNSGDDEVFENAEENSFENVHDTPVDKMMRLRELKSVNSDYYESREVFCDVCFKLGFRTCTYPCRNSRDKSLIPSWIFVKLPRDHIWFNICIEAINEVDDRDRYYALIMNNERYCKYHPNDFEKCSHVDILTLGYIICHQDKQVTDRYWINKMDETYEVLVDDTIAKDLECIKAFRDRLKINDLD